MTTGAAPASAPEIVARFDDLRSGKVVEFGSPEGEIVARSPEDVLPALAEVERVTRAGRWAFGFVAYEAAAGLDDAFPRREPPPGLPLVWFGVARRPVAATDWDVASGTYDAGPWTLEWSEAEHARQVDAVRRAIAEGQTYQCNLTARMSSTFRGDPFAFYRTLARNQGGSHNAYLDLGRFVVIGASPECFFDWSGAELTMAPMKGTAPRGLGARADLEARRGLLASRKDHAENVMIVDLVRNDLSRLAEPGTVEVSDLLACERYGTVWQLTSTVSAQIRPTATLPGVFRALFPSGSVTGAPKARAMQIIDSLESSPRGVYCGAVGYVAPGSATRARFNVAIRTVVLDRETGSATYGVGGAVTWSSTAAGEYQELQTKAHILDVPPEPDFDLIDTFRLSAQGAVHLEHHLDRLAASAEYFDFRFDRAAVAEAVTRAGQTVRGDRIVRVRLTRDGEVDISTRNTGLNARGPVALAIDTQPIDPTSRFTYHKTTVRDVFEQARQRHPEADDVVLVNPAGRVTETTVANIAALVDGTWVTPPVEDGCLPGVGRQLMLADGSLTERSITVQDLLAAEQIALVSSARGWRRARLI